MEGISILTEDQVKDVQTIIQQMLAATAGDKKISQLDAISTVADADLLAIVDDTDTTTKKCTAAQLKEHIQTLGDKDEFTISSVPTTSFPLSNTPSGNDSLGVFRNGFLQPTSFYNIVGSTLNWTGTQLQLNEKIIVWYDFQAPVFGLFKGTHAGTMPTGGANLVVTAASLGLTDARQIVMSLLKAKGTDNNWWNNGNTFAATHAFTYSIPTGADPNAGDMVIQAPVGSTTVHGQAFEFIYLYQTTNFLS